MKRKIIFSLSALILLTTFAYSQGQFNALLITKTAGWHHESISPGITAIKKLAVRHNFNLHWNENEKNFFTEEFLMDMDVVIFLNTTEDILTDEQQAVFKRFIQSGKGFVGIHSASDTEYDWPWYNQLVGRMFHVHPIVQSAMVDVEDANFPGMEIFPKRFLWTDEWYEFKKEIYSKDLKVLLALDESTYNTRVRWDDRSGDGMGYHPIAWYQYFDGGRSFYTGLGHVPAVFEDPWFLNHVYGGIYWAATGKGIKK